MDSFLFSDFFDPRQLRIDFSYNIEYAPSMRLERGWSICFIAETGLFERFEHGKCVFVGRPGGLVDKEVAVTVVEEEVGDALDVE